MDAIDRRILSLLMEDGRRTYDDIARQVNLTAPSVKRRVDRLRTSGALQGYTAATTPRSPKRGASPARPTRSPGSAHPTTPTSSA